MLMLDKELKDRLNASEGAAIWQHMNSLLIKFFDAFLSEYQIIWIIKATVRIPVSTWTAYFR
jgi:hypothetical protein